jgi:hypothetical protein
MYCESRIILQSSWGDFCLYSLDKLHLLRIMPSCYSQLELPVVSGQHTISKYRSLVHMSSYIGTFFMWKQISACFIFTWPEKLYPFLCAIFLYLLSCLMEPTGKCYLSSRFHLKLMHRTISANAVHVWGYWQHLKGHWVKGERQSCVTQPTMRTTSHGIWFSKIVWNRIFLSLLCLKNNDNTLRSKFGWKILHNATLTLTWFRLILKPYPWLVNGGHCVILYKYPTVKSEGISFNFGVIG